MKTTGLITALIAIAFVTFMAAADSHPTKIIVSFDGVPETAQRDFQIAAKNWERCLITKAPIKIRVAWIKRGPTGFAFPRVVRNKDHLPVKDSWYPSALASALAGKRDSDLDDMNIFLSARTQWYYTTPETIGAGQTDYINVAMHEIAHGLGISSAGFIPFRGEPIGSIGFPNEYINYFSYSFPVDMKQMDGTPMLYDRFIRLADGRSLMDFENPSLSLAMAMANPTVHFAGQNAIKANNGYPVGVVPTNLSHIPKFPGRTTPIMLPDSGKGETVHKPDGILLGMLSDLGWTIAPACLR